MVSSIKIVFDSENQENNAIVVNGQNVMNSISKINFEWNANGVPQVSIVCPLIKFK